MLRAKKSAFSGLNPSKTAGKLDKFHIGEAHKSISLIWVNSYNKLASENAEIQHKYIHLNQLYETESKSKWQYLAQIEELSKEVKTLREEAYIKALKL